MATVDFTATHEGHTATRSSGTMPYVAAVFGVGVTWHKSFAAAHKAARSGQHVYNNPMGGVVVPVVAVKFNGKPSDRWPETVTEGWGNIPAETMRALLADKLGLAPEVAEEEATEVADVDAAEAILAEGTPTADGGLVLEPTQYVVTRDTADHSATDENRAMAHVRIGVVYGLENAREALAMALVEEAGWLVKGRDILKVRDAWAFRRAAALVELSGTVGTLDPHAGPGPHAVITRTVEGLLFTIRAIEPRR